MLYICWRCGSWCFVNKLIAHLTGSMYKRCRSCRIAMMSYSERDKLIIRAHRNGAPETKEKRA